VNDDIILVDIFDKETGSAEKMEAHRQKKLHRAFSLFIADKHGNMLLQKSI
jgi:isopentenyl-diphosphate delta-isomerase